MGSNEGKLLRGWVHQLAPLQVRLDGESGGKDITNLIGSSAGLAVGNEIEVAIIQGALYLIGRALGDTGWINVSGFTNGWAATAETPQYRKINGVVFLQGIMASGTVGAVDAFTLPIGFRPSQLIALPVMSFDGTNYVLANNNILTGGQYRARVGSNANMSITCSFVAA